MALLRLGVNVRIGAPKGYQLTSGGVEDPRSVEGEKFGQLTLTRTPEEAVKNANVVYTDAWVSMGAESEARERRKKLRNFQVTSDLMAKADKNAIFMHCLPAFHDAVKEANVSFVMCAYNRLNGVHSSANDHLMKGILKDQWGFKGPVLSDWSALKSSESLGHGIDIEMPYPTHYSPANILNAIEKNTFTQAQLDDSVRRLLRVIVTKGFMDRPQKRNDLPTDSPASCAVALNVAREAVVLLKNQDRVLPINRSKCRKIAVFGSRAVKTPILGYGSGSFAPLHQIDFLDGIRKAAGSQIAVQYVPPIAEDYKTFPLCRTSADGEPGLNLNVKVRLAPTIIIPPAVVENVDFTRANPAKAFLGISPDQKAEACFSGVLVAPEDSDWEIVAPGMQCFVGDDAFAYYDVPGNGWKMSRANFRLAWANRRAISGLTGDWLSNRASVFCCRTGSNSATFRRD